MSENDSVRLLIVKAMQNDSEMILRYVEDGSEAAFRSIVDRYIGVVYSAALRILNGNSHLAQDVTQDVFSHLALKASKLPAGVVLAGWLHRDACFRALTTVRSERRRKERERTAAEMNTAEADLNRAWDAIACHLDESLNSLSRRDREVLVLRFLNNLDLRSVGVVLGVTEDAAQKRVTRAIERLRLKLRRKGLICSMGGLGAVIACKPATAVPATLSAIVSTKAVVVAQAGASLSALESAFGLKASAAAICVAAAVVIAVPTIIYKRAASELGRQEGTLATQSNELVTLRTQAAMQASAQPSKETSVAGESLELLRLRGEVGRLRVACHELLESATNRPASREGVLAAIRQVYSDRVDRLKDYFAQHPTEAVPEMARLTGADWLEFVMYDHHRIDPDGRKAVSSVRSTSQIKFGLGELLPALTAYAKANGGSFPDAISDLKPYFRNTVSDSILEDWTIVGSSDLPPSLAMDEPRVISQRRPIDPLNDQRYVIGIRSTRLGTGTNQWGMP